MLTAETFENAHAEYGRVFIGWLCRRGVKRDVAEDIAQESWMNAWRFRDKFRAECPLRVWLFSIVRRTMSHHFRKRREDMQLLFDGNLTSTHVELDARIEADQILRHCKPANATLLRRHYLEDSTPAYGAHDYTAVHVRLLRARREIRLSLEGNPKRAWVRRH